VLPSQSRQCLKTGILGGKGGNRHATASSRLHVSGASLEQNDAEGPETNNESRLNPVKDSPPNNKVTGRDGGQYSRVGS